MTAISQYRVLLVDDEPVIRRMAAPPGQRRLHAVHRGQASLGLAKSLGMKTVAEGVEHAQDWALLKDLACDVAQAFYAARPMPAAEGPAWAKIWRGSYIHHPLPQRTPQ